ncbi:MAG: NHL repeat-containing protein [bacterium]
MILLFPLIVLIMPIDLSHSETATAAEGTEESYEVLWHTTGLPDGIPLSRPQGCCLDPVTSRIYVADTENNRVMVFTTEGTAIGTFYTSRPVERPFDIAIGPDRRIYISQIERHVVEVFDQKGVWQVSIPADKGLSLAPGRMGFDHKGRLLVNDRKGGALWLMTKEGKILEKLHELKGDTRIILLTGLAVGPTGRIHVTSAQHSPVVTILEPEGTKFLSFGRHGALYDDSFSFPSSLALDSAGRIWVVDAFRHAIKVFDPEGKFLFNVGTFGEEPGRFVYPVDIDADRDGRMYVLEKGAGRLQAFSVAHNEAK